MSTVSAETTTPVLMLSDVSICPSAPKQRRKHARLAFNGPTTDLDEAAKTLFDDEDEDEDDSSDEDEDEDEDKTVEKKPSAGWNFGVSSSDESESDSESGSDFDDEDDEDAEGAKGAKGAEGAEGGPEPLTNSDLGAAHASLTEAQCRSFGKAAIFAAKVTARAAEKAERAFAKTTAKATARADKIVAKAEEKAAAKSAKVSNKLIAKANKVNAKKAAKAAAKADKVAAKAAEKAAAKAIKAAAKVAKKATKEARAPMGEKAYKLIGIVKKSRKPRVVGLSDEEMLQRRAEQKVESALLRKRKENALPHLAQNLVDRVRQLHTGAFSDVYKVIDSRAKFIANVPICLAEAAEIIERTTLERNELKNIVQKLSNANNIDEYLQNEWNYNENHSVGSYSDSDSSSE